MIFIETNNNAKTVLFKYLDNPYWVYTGFSLIMLFFGFALARPAEIVNGLITIVLAPDILITDYIKIGGLGAAFVNSALVMLMSISILIISHHKPTRLTIASLMLAGGFALFGKNPVNMTPIIFGGYLFSLYAKEPFHKNALATLLGTALSPAVSQITFAKFPGPYSSYFGILSAIFVGAVIGFIIEPIAKNSIKSHEGYNLYNVGFAAGILGIVINSIFRSFGMDSIPVRILSSGNNTIINIFLLCISVYFFFVGFILVGGDLRECYSLLIELNEKGSYLSKIHGVEYLKMGVIGILVIIYIRAFGYELNGPVIGGVFTIIGFSCSGKKITSMIPVMIGATISGLLNLQGHDPTLVLIAILFSTCLSPIAEKFGFFWGVVAGFIHFAVSTNIGLVNGGLNLYNNGLAGGFVVMTLVPLIRAFSVRFKREQAKAAVGQAAADSVVAGD